MKKEEILEECQSIVDEVCEKYNYDTIDTEGNDSLRTVLLKAIPAMLVDKPKEDREMFYQMIKHTPIVVTENLTLEEYEKIEDKYIGNINPHIQTEKLETGEYGKEIGAGAYVSAPIISEEMKVIGKKSFVYLQKISGEKKEILGTDINVSHLIHELGHAWASEKDEYVMTEDNKLIRKNGTAKFEFSFVKKEERKSNKKFR